MKFIHFVWIYSVPACNKERPCLCICCGSSPNELLSLFCKENCWNIRKFSPHQLVVLCQTLWPAGGASLDLRDKFQGSGVDKRRRTLTIDKSTGRLRNILWSVCTCPVQSPTTRSEMKVSSVSPERWLTITPQPLLWASLHLATHQKKRQKKMIKTDASGNKCNKQPWGALRLDGLGDGANLVDFEQQTVAGLLVNSLLDPLGVGHCQVVSYNLKGRKSKTSLNLSESDAAGDLQRQKLRLTWMSVEAVNLAHCSQSSWSNGSSMDCTGDKQVAGQIGSVTSHCCSWCKHWM